MTKVLIIEDDEQKLAHVARWIGISIDGAVVDEAKAFATGKAKLMGGVYDLVLVDMTLPVYDVTSTESGYETMFFAGRDLLKEMARKGLLYPTIVITQFEQFGEGDSKMTLVELRDELSREFGSNYLGTVYYHPSQDAWQHEIMELIPGLLS